MAEALEQAPERQREGRAAELAWHWMETGNARRALSHVLLVCDQAEAAYAHQEAERHYQMARDLARCVETQDESLAKAAVIATRTSRLKPRKWFSTTPAFLQQNSINLPYFSK